MRFLKMRGLFCRTCGIAVHREMTTKTLWQGWYGIGSFVFTPATLLLNLASRARFGRMTPPVNGLRPPLDPGKPVVRRVGALGVLVPFLIVGALAIGAEPDDDNGNTPGVSECTNVGGTECA